jgi:hypothetical protein
MASNDSASTSDVVMSGSREYEGQDEINQEIDSLDESGQGSRINASE